MCLNNHHKVYFQMVCKGMYGYVSVCYSILQYIGVCRGMLRYFRLCWGMYRYIRVYQGMLRRLLGLCYRHTEEVYYSNSVLYVREFLSLQFLTLYNICQIYIPATDSQNPLPVGY